MPTPGIRNWFPVRPAGVLALLAVALSAGPTVASCGDYLHIAPRVNVPDQASERHAAEGPTKPAAPPCQGPNCSADRSPPSPLSPSPVVAKPAPHDALLLPSGVNEATLFGPLAETPRRYPVRRPTAIFRPPRHL